MSKSRWPGSLAFGSGVFLGLTLLVSGTGKLPGQTEFFDVLLRSFWTPHMAYLISHYLPWVEIVLGVLLVLGVIPKVAAVLSLLLLVGFMANNVWALSQRTEKFSSCSYCFGKWEKLLGVISPAQALCLDLTLFCLALFVVLLYPGGFLNFRPWFIKKKEGGGAA